MGAWVAGRAIGPWMVSGGCESLAGGMHVCMNSPKVLMDCSEPVCLTFAPVRAFTMASVPSAGCLLAKNQYYRTRLNSESSVSSGSSSFCSDPVNFSDQEKAHHGLPELFDKCWWIKNFFHSETSASPNMSGKTLSTSSCCKLTLPAVVIRIQTTPFSKAQGLSDGCIQLCEENTLLGTSFPREKLEFHKDLSVA
ncbi:unnamed protein product [Lepidochelys olivacea]